MLIGMPIEFLNANLDADVDLGTDLAARWAFYKDVISFGSLLESFASMTDVIMLSNWPIFMDAAGDVGNWYVATVFFYSFKVRSGRSMVAIIYLVPALAPCTKLPRSQCKNRDKK